MGALHLRDEPIRLDALIGDRAIAVVHPDDPPYVTVPVVHGGPVGDGPDRPAVRFDLVWERFVVDAWLRPPPGAAPDRIEVFAPVNATIQRDAYDAANGMLGHVHHVVQCPRLVDVPDAWTDVRRDGPRIAFLEPNGPRGFTEPYDGLSVAVIAREALAERIRPPDPPPRRRWWPF